MDLGDSSHRWLVWVNLGERVIVVKFLGQVGEGRPGVGDELESLLVIFERVSLT